MRNKTIHQRLGLMVLLAMVCSFSAQAKGESNKWRLQFSGGANSDGAIVFLLSSPDGQSHQATVAIEDGRSENGVAKDVVNGLREQLPDEHYKIERDDGEDVLIKRKRGTANFDIEIVSNSVDGVRIRPQKE